MLKKIIASSLVAATLVLSGCGDSDSAGEDRLAAQHAIDSGDAAKAISLLEPTAFADLNSTQRTAFLASISDTDKMTLASAYMKKADVSIMDIVSKLDTKKDKDGNDVETSFASIAEDIIGEGNTTAKINAIDTAIAYYEAMGSSPTVAGAPSFKAASVNDVKKTVEGAKLYLGMAYFSKVTMLLSFFGDVAALEKDNSKDYNGTYEDSYDATQEAIKCIYNSDCTTANFSMDYEWLVIGSAAVFSVDVNGKTFYRFATTGTTETNKGSMLILDYKYLDDKLTYQQVSGEIDWNSIVRKTGVFGSGYIFEEQILKALNSAYGLILETAPDDVKVDMKKDFEEIDTGDLGGGSFNNGKPNEYISMDEIRAYMAKD